MAYFNLGDIKKVKVGGAILKFRRIGLGSILVITIVVAFVVVYILEKAPGIKEEPTSPKVLDEQTKQQILESLSAPPGAPVYTEEEKRRILESLSAPQGSTLTEEEKKAILESLSAPK
ncbi:MAG: hypothetical protein WAP23_00220 [Candidatus Spechtbacterales bacterium]